MSKRRRRVPAAAARVSLAQAQKIAERLRTRVASHDMEVAGHITISLGVAHWGADATSIAAVLKGGGQGAL